VSALVPLRLRRDTGWQRAFERRAARTVRDLAAWSRAARPLDRRLAALRSALAASPYWRDRLRGHGLSPLDLRTVDDLRHFPVLSRAELAAAGFDAVSRPEAPGLVAVRSSGSTGQPVTVYRDAWETVHMWAVLRFFCERLGIALPPRPRVVLLCSLPNGLTYSSRLPLLGNGALHRVSIAAGDAVERLRRVRPAVIFSDPAGLHWLSTRDVPSPRLVLSSAQHLGHDVRTTVAERLRAPVIDYYASTETGPVAWSCPAGDGFHVLRPEVHVESLDGRLLVTRLRRSPVPLLRYDMGDGGQVVEGSCACGHRGPSVAGLAGRRAALFVTPAGQAVDAWQLAWVFKHAPLTTFRLEQVGPSDFRLLLDPAAPDEVCALLRPAMERLGWPAPRLEVRRAQVPAAPGDKPAPFVAAAESWRWSAQPPRLPWQSEQEPSGSTLSR
jgi:phenylacetate-CoA ligase